MLAFETQTLAFIPERLLGTGHRERRGECSAPRTGCSSSPRVPQEPRAGARGGCPEPGARPRVPGARAGAGGARAGAAGVARAQGQPIGSGQRHSEA